LNNKNLIVIVGPTAIGKTSLSIDLANKFKCEIISADSRQFYKEISIGTAKPTDIELSQVPHHFINNLSIHDEYSAGKFELDALKCLELLFKQSDYAILVGGSGMYIDAVCKGIDEIPSNKEIRESLNLEFAEYGIKPLQNELKEKDPTHFAKMDIKNPQRLIRALEVCRITGETYSSFRNNKPKNRAFNIIKIGLFADKDVLHQRINLRVDQMMNSGWLNEIKDYSAYSSLNSLNTVGYKELFQYKNQDISLENTIEEIKKNTRKFAKRQMTWFKKDKEIKWFNYLQIGEVYNLIKNQS
jgi:tRNA dimethylallyltransferase